MLEEQDPEALRRRLYRPGASDEDRLRYLATRPGPEPGTEPEPLRPRSHRPLVPAVVLGLVLLLVVGVALGRGRMDRALPPPTGPVAGPVPKRILPSSQVVVAMNGSRRTAWRILGTGSGEVPLDVSTASSSGGILVVLLSSTDERPVGWRALTPGAALGSDADEVVTATRPPRDREGATRADVVPYPGAPPERLEVEAPADAFWTLTVAFGTGPR